MTLGFLTGSENFSKLLWVSCEVLVLHGYAWIHRVAGSCTTTAYRWLFRDSQLSLRTLWSAVIKSPKFTARSTASPLHLLHGALVILVFLQISQFRSRGEMSFNTVLTNVGSTEASWEELAWESPFSGISSSTKFSLNSCSHSGISEFNGFAPFYRGFLSDLSSTEVDTCTGEVSLLIPSSRSRTDISPTVGEEGEDEEDEEEWLSCFLWGVWHSPEWPCSPSWSRTGDLPWRSHQSPGWTSTESTISTSLIHCIASVGNCEQIHTSVLNLIYQQAKVAGREFVEMMIRNLQSLLVCSIILWRVSSIEEDWIFGWRSILASQILILFLPYTFLHCGRMEAALRVMNSIDAILLDNVLMKTHLDWQIRFPKNHVCPKCLAALLCGTA